jgi:hypothetical protein
MRPLHILIALVFATLAVPAYCQRDLAYDDVVVPQNRVDARDLGYAPVDMIPDGESAITSLTVAPNGDLYGATSGSRAHLFVFNPRHGYVQPLGVISSAASIANAVVVSATGDVYIGTAPNGHMFKYTPRDDYRKQIEIDKALAITDLGQPIAGESIFAMAIDRSANVIYGLTSPGAHLFEFAIASGKAEDLGVIAEKPPFGEKFEKDKMISRMLLVDQQGMVWASGEGGSFFRFDPKARKLQKLDLQVPAVPGRQSWTRVDAFLLDPSGLIYGGTSDGYLFCLDPARLTVANLGKPLSEYRIDGLVRVPDGRLYGVGGDKDDMARLFSYTPVTGAYEVLGFLDVNRRPYYTWQAYAIGALVCGLDGTVYLGEDERISKLFLFYPQSVGPNPAYDPN